MEIGILLLSSLFDLCESEFVFLRVNRCSNKRNISLRCGVFICIFVLADISFNKFGRSRIFKFNHQT